MTGTKAGGKLAAKRNTAKDPDFYKKIGAKGGRNGHTGGFYENSELARRAGRKGGRISKRGSAKSEWHDSPEKKAVREEEAVKKAYTNLLTKIFGK